MCRFLVEECGVDPREGATNRRARRGYSGRTALHWAARNGHVEVLRWLVGKLEEKEEGEEGQAEGGAAVGGGRSSSSSSSSRRRRRRAVDVGTADGTTAFCWAAWQGQLAACRFLHEEARCDPHLGNGYGCNAAMWAAQGGHLGVLRYLRCLGVDLAGVNATRQGCLHKAAQRGHAAVCEWLLGPEVGLLDPARQPPEVVRRHAGANEGEGSRPPELARYGGHDALAEWLRARLPPPQSQSS